MPMIEDTSSLPAGSNAGRCVHLSSVHAADDTRIFHKECVALEAAGFEMHLVAQPRVNPGSPNGVRVHTLTPIRGRLRRMTRVVSEVRRVALRLDADIYHFHDSELIPLGLELRARGKRVIYDVHEDLPATIRSKPYLPPGVRPLVIGAAEVAELVMGRAATAIVAATPTIARRFPVGKTTVVHNFPILSELSTPSLRTFRERPQTVVYAGGLSLQRGAVEMVQAVGLTMPGTRLALVGSFDTSETRTHVIDVAGWDRVDEHGWQPRSSLGALFANARVGMVVLHPEPNYVESLPTKLFEYMSVGLPVIASDFPLWREIVESHQCGVLVNPLSAVEIAEAINWMIEHPDESEAMGRRGRAAVEQIYNWDGEATRLIALYRRLLAGRSIVDGYTPTIRSTIG